MNAGRRATWPRTAGRSALHATYDETITRFLDVFEAVNRDVPFDGLRWFFDHAETISDRNIERVKALGGGIAVQHRMAFQGEYFVDRYGKQGGGTHAADQADAEDGGPGRRGHRRHARGELQPVGRALLARDAARRWAGTALYPEANRLDRAEALRRYTVGSAWFSRRKDKKGSIEAGQLADLAVLSADYFKVPEEEIKGIESVLTVVGGKVVYAAGEFAETGPAAAARQPRLVAGQGLRRLRARRSDAGCGGETSGPPFAPRTRPLARGEGAQVGARRVGAVGVGLRVRGLLNVQD